MTISRKGNKLQMLEWREIMCPTKSSAFKLETDAYCSSIHFLESLRIFKSAGSPMSDYWSVARSVGLKMTIARAQHFSPSRSLNIGLFLNHEYLYF